MAKIFPVILKLLPIVLACIASNNWAQLQSPEGIDAVRALLYVFLPGLAGVASAGGAFYVDSREKRIALETDHPVEPTADEDAVVVNAGGVKLSLRVDRKASADPAFRSSVVEMVKSSLAVRGGGTK
jgi:hypothetical protein